MASAPSIVQILGRIEGGILLEQPTLVCSSGVGAVVNLCAGAMGGFAAGNGVGLVGGTVVNNIGVGTNWGAGHVDRVALHACKSHIKITIILGVDGLLSDADRVHGCMARGFDSVGVVKGVMACGRSIVGRVLEEQPNDMRAEATVDGLVVRTRGGGRRGLDLGQVARNVAQARR